MFRHPSYNEKYFQNDPEEFGMSYDYFPSNQHLPKIHQLGNLHSHMQSVHSRHDDGDYNNRCTFFLDIRSLQGISGWIQKEMNTRTDFNSSKDPSYGFSQSNSLEHALEILEKGDNDLFKNVEGRSREKTKDFVAKSPLGIGISRDVEGMYFDTGLYLQGEPEAFFQQENELVNMKMITVHIDGSYNSGVESHEVVEAMVTLIAAINVLELSGHRVAVKLWWLSTRNSDDRNVMNAYHFEVKGHREHMNIQRMIGVFHPAFFRRIIFRIDELFNLAVSGYGRAFDYNNRGTNVVAIEDLIGEDVEEVIERIKNANLATNY